ncbi:fructose-6-phosphate aldolase [Aminithiophilus ramosus]|uniref:Probable transaldolase n=1 Tax=Aminithiophilus ramosus TaxID=3029084 RepID=A0A9Q7EWF1_9BACT|nr:fructose-6-phosphate aldolase [Aminithiophilus ramosus]QTX31600.1 fructose-6-phosphate aldolase [Aminithiophilus ramosus]
MRFFLDTANLEEIREAAAWGVVDGVTTNPSLVAREGDLSFRERVKAIADIVAGPVSAEAVSLEGEAMLREARELALLSPHVVVKIPMTPEGMGVVRTLSREGRATNVTLVFSVNQALLAAAAGATYVSPFVGRLDDTGQDGMGLVREIVSAFRAGSVTTRVLAASVRHPRHVAEAALAGADVVTLPFKVLKQIFHHPLTEKGIASFVADWESYRSRHGDRA